jgi:hypothetical protein
MHEDKHVASLKELGRVAHIRAQDQEERRFCGSKSNESTGAHVELSTNEKLNSCAK